MSGLTLGPVSSVTLSRKTKRSPGRPRKVDLLPVNKEVAVIQKQKEDHLKQDDLTNILADNPNSLDVLDQLMLELAREAASLHFERNEAERNGQDTSVLSSKKVTALKSVADVYFRKRDSIIDQAFDFKSSRFQSFIDWFLQKIIHKSAVESGLSTEQINILFDHIASKFEDNQWEKEAMAYIKSD